MNRSTKMAAGIAAAITLLGGSVAYGYLTTPGVGAAVATVASGDGNFDVSVTVSGPALTPGGLSDTVSYKVENNLGEDRALNSVTVALDDGTGYWTGANGCSYTDFRFVDASGSESTGSIAMTNLNVTVTSSTPYEDSVSFKMVETGVNQDACKNLQIPIRVTVN